MLTLVFGLLLREHDRNSCQADSHHRQAHTFWRFR